MHNHKEDSIFKRASKVLEYTHCDRISKMGSQFFKTFKPKKFETFSTYKREQKVFKKFERTTRIQKCRILSLRLKMEKIERHGEKINFLGLFANVF